SKELIKKQIKDVYLYKSIIESIIYTIIRTRFNLAHVITLLLQFNVCLNQEHLTAVKYTLRYLNKTRDFKLFYSKEKDLKLKDYYDASYILCSNIRKSYLDNSFRLADYIVT